MPALVSGGALAGLRVVDTATLYAGPFISTLLADHGADVVKVEPPGGDDYRWNTSRMWPLLARNKRSVVLDLRDEGDRDRLLRLVAVADVVVLNMPEATLAKRGLTHDRLREANPELVIAQVTGFGMDGPAADRPGNGTLAEAYAGLTHMTGDPEGPPTLSSVPLGDAVTGFAGAFAVLAACLHQRAGGGGQVVDVNPLEVMLHAVGPMVTQHQPGTEPPGRLGSKLAGSTVRNVFRAADGRWVAIGLSTVRHVADGAALVGHDGPVEELDDRVRDWVAARPRDEVVAALVAARLPVAAVNDAAEVLADPHLSARSSVVEVDTVESGPVWSPAPAPPRPLATPATGAGRTPALGEHTDEVFREWGA